jgi:hypothetical protein
VKYLLDEEEYQEILLQHEGYRRMIAHLVCWIGGEVEITSEQMRPHAYTYDITPIMGKRKEDIKGYRIESKKNR